jgi:N-methylhydantoinase A
VNIRVVAREHGAITELPSFPQQSQNGSGQQCRNVYFGPDIGTRQTPILSRADLRGCDDTSGPLVLEEYDATVVIPPGWRAHLDEGGSVLLRRL